jgi:hypothetical protein
MTKLRIASLGLLAVVVGASTTRAQDLPTFAGGAGVMLSVQPSRDVPFAGPSVSRTGVGGAAIGITSEIGLFVTRAVNIAFEFSVPKRFDSVQEYTTFIGFRNANRHRELILSPLVRVSLYQSGRAHLAVAGGPSFVREDTLQRRSDQIRLPVSPFVGDFGPYGPERRVTQ